MFGINRDIEYALMCLNQLAASNAILTSTQIARRTAAPASFVAKVLQKLTRAGILESAQGVAGGYRLRIPAERLTVAQVIAAVHGTTNTLKCARSAEFDSCTHLEGCTIRPGMLNLWRRWEGFLAGMTLDDFFASRSLHAGEESDTSQPSLCEEVHHAG